MSNKRILVDKVNSFYDWSERRPYKKQDLNLWGSG